MTLNIRNGGGVHRLDGITRHIEIHSPDVLVLTEYRENHNSDLLREYLTKNGFLYLTAGSNDSRMNSVLIASRIRFTPYIFEDLVELEGERSLLGARFENFRLIGCCLLSFSENNEAIKYLSENTATFFKGQYGRDFGVVVGAVKSTKKLAGEEPLICWRGMEDQGMVELDCEKESCADECSIQNQNDNFFRKNFVFVTSNLMEDRVSSVVCSPSNIASGNLEYSEMLVEVSFGKRLASDDTYLFDKWAQMRRH